MKKIILTFGLLCVGLSYSHNTPTKQTDIQESLIKLNNKLDEAIDFVSSDSVLASQLRYTEK